MNEMEHVEAQKGCYSSTEGLLYLLTVLIKTCGCPPDLGSQWRPRPGCTPYIEYVVDFVLPRAMGSKKGEKALYFASSADKYRLISRALEVIEAAVIRHYVPTTEMNLVYTADSHTSTAKKVTLSSQVAAVSYESAMKKASENGMSLVTEKIFHAGNKDGDSDCLELIEAVRDYKNEMLPVGSVPTVMTEGGLSSSDFRASPRDGAAAHAETELTSVAVPRAKTPGFTILSKILSSSRGSLFFVLTQLLIEDGGAGGIDVVHGQSGYSQALAMALFGETTPDYAVAKPLIEYYRQQQSQAYGNGVPSRLPPTPAHWIPSFIHPLYPPVVHSRFESNGTTGSSFSVNDDGLSWRENSILLSLRLLCAAAAREEAFGSAVHRTSSTLSIIPVLHFRAPIRGSYVGHVLESRDVNVTRLSQLLVDSTGHRSFHTEAVPALAQYIGYKSCAVDDDEDIAKSAMSILCYLINVLPQQDSLAIMCGREVDGRNRLAEAFARRLLMPTSGGQTLEPSNQTEGLRHAILNLILSDMCSNGQHYLSQVLLGLSEGSFSVAKTSSRGETLAVSEVMKTHNCLDAALDLISDANFVLSPETSAIASKCYELASRLFDSNMATLNVSVLSKFRMVDFWNVHLLRFIAESGNCPSIMRVAVGRLEGCGETRYACDILHCIAWVLKGCATELFALAGHLRPHRPTQEPSDLLNMFAPQPTKLRRLLSLLLGHPQYLMREAMSLFPMKRPAVAHHLSACTLPRDLIQNSSRAMEGPVDIVADHLIVDEVALVSLLRGQEGDSKASQSSAAPKTDQESAAVRWAKAWNSYAECTCASSHLAKAWGLTMGASLACCEESLLQDGNSILGVRGVIDLLCSLLSLLCTESNSQSSILEPGISLPMSVVVLQLIDFISMIDASPRPTNLSQAAPIDAPQKPLQQEDMVKICSLLCGAIASCAGGPDDIRNKERAAILGYGLTGILTSMRKWSGAESFGEKLLLRRTREERDTCLTAALFLASASTQTGMSQDVTGTSAWEGEKQKSISCAARSGLTSLLTFFDWLEGLMLQQMPSFDDSFILRVYSSVQNTSTSPGSNSLARLTQALEMYDGDAAQALQRVASCRNGTYILLNLGVTTSLIAAATKYAKEAFGPGGGLEEIVERETYGSKEIECPAFLHGHISLLNAMLASCSDLTPPARQRLLRDAAETIRWYSSTGDRLLRTYPKYIDLTTKFLTCLHLLGSTLSQDTKKVTENKISTFPNSDAMGNILGNHIASRLDRRVVDLTSHLSEFPFPAHLLPHLPARLEAVERTKLSRTKYLSMNVSNGTSWWDLLPPDNSAFGLDALILPNPPAGSTKQTGLWSGLSRSGHDMANEKKEWTEQKYEYALASARCLEICLMYLQCRSIDTRSSLNMILLDGVAIAKGLCRCSDALRGIHDRLTQLRQSEGTDLTTMIHNAFSMSDKVTSTVSNYAEKVEREAFLSLCPSLAGSVSILLHLASVYTKKLTADYVTAHGTGNEMQIKNEIGEFMDCILPAFEHTQIETAGIVGIGDSSMSYEDSFNKALAKQVRDELNRLSRGY